MKSKGAYIVLEGIDGAGTTTHAEILSSSLSRLGYCTRVFEEPSKGRIGHTIREYLSKGPFDQRVLALLFAADRLELARSIESAIDEGCIAIGDRSWVSSIVYQSYEGFPSSAPLEWLYTINKYAPRPDAVIYIDVDPVIAFRRISLRSKHRDLPETLSALRGLAAQYRRILPLLARIIPLVVTVKGSEGLIERSIEAVSREILVAVLVLLRLREAQGT